MTGNLIEKYFEHRINNIVAYSTLLLEKVFEEKFQWHKQLSQCAEYYYKNYVLVSNYNLKLIIKYRRYFENNNVTDRRMQIIFVCIFESMINFKELKNNDIQKTVLTIGKCINIATIIDEEINSLSSVNVDFNDIYTTVINYIKKDEQTLELFNSIKSQLQLVVEKNLEYKRKFSKLISLKEFHLDLIPLFRKNRNKQIYEVKPKYDIKSLAKYKLSEVDYVYSSSDVDVELIFIAYTYVCSLIIKTIEMKKNDYYLIKLDNKFFKKKKHLTKLTGLMSKNGYCKYVIFEIETEIIEKYSESIKRIREFGGFISVSNPNLKTDQRLVDYININKDNYYLKDLFEKYGKDGKAVIISNVDEEEYQKFIDYRKKDVPNI